MIDPSFLVKPAGANIQDGVQIAKTAPTIDFAYFPGQDHIAPTHNPWSDWGDGSTAGTKYYTSIGDHGAPHGDAQCYEYDSASKQLRMLMRVKTFLEQPGIMPASMDYIPGKIHSRTDIGSDGWVYFSTHRGGTSDNTTDKRGYLGDWIDLPRLVHRPHPAVAEQFRDLKLRKPGRKLLRRRRHEPRSMRTAALL